MEQAGEPYVESQRDHHDPNEPENLRDNQPGAEYRGKGSHYKRLSGRHEQVEVAIRYTSLHYLAAKELIPAFVGQAQIPVPPRSSKESRERHHQHAAQHQG